MESKGVCGSNRSPINLLGANSVTGEKIVEQIGKWLNQSCVFEVLKSDAPHAERDERQIQELQKRISSKKAKPKVLLRRSETLRILDS